MLTNKINPTIEEPKCIEHVMRLISVASGWKDRAGRAQTRERAKSVAFPPELAHRAG